MAARPCSARSRSCPKARSGVALYGDKPLADFAIKEWAGTDAGKQVVAAPANSGGGAPGGGKGATGKTMLRSAFDALPHGERAAFAKDGGRWSIKRPDETAPLFVLVSGWGEPSRMEPTRRGQTPSKQRVTLIRRRSRRLIRMKGLTGSKRT
jgi:hypothetical protein